MSDETTPAEKYAGFRAGRRHPVLHEFGSFYDFGLDDFQLRACREVEDGRGVLVAAPTGSGKTVVGEFAVFLALVGGRKCFYTTPIKALSNQKYHDLVARHGAENVGLLTGDTAVNGEAPVVVMTTEVLRNMIYAGSPTLLGLAFVVMDEVHYLADRSRGAVWEEVIIHLPESVQVIALSATVSNAEEFGEWLGTVRGEVSTIVEEKRPVPLFQHVMPGRRLLDLFASSDHQASTGFVGEGAPVNEELMKIARDDWAATKLRDRRGPKDRQGPRDRRGGRQGGRSNNRQGDRRNVGNGRRVWIPSRVEVIQRLEREKLLPAIVFIFSRKGCDAAVQQCLDADVRLNSGSERDEVVEYVETLCAHLPEEDRRVLDYHDFLDALSRGVAAHHAGMLPVFKECVEKLFTQGLCKVVFATETLALGINMPARTVVIEKLSKWNGREHADLTPGEYTQLTGRAGRRGLDVEGHGVVLWQPGMNPKQVAGLASTRTYPLKSSFRPSYNMAVNLVQQFGRDRSRELLEMSFAQFQADKAVVGLARQLRKAEDAMEGYADAAQCDRGDFMGYAALRRRISEVEKDAARARRNERRDDAAASLFRLKPGDVIDVPTGKFAGLALVLDPGDGDQPRPQVLTLDKQVRRLAMIDFPVPVESLDRMRVPKNFNPRNPQQRRDLAGALRNQTRGLARPQYAQPRRGGVDPSVRDELDLLRAELKSHPCHACPDREDHARWAERWVKLDRDAQTLRQRVERRTNTVARTFDRVCEVLTDLGYLELDSDGDRVTPRGKALRRIYSELDLLAAESIRLDLWEDLTVPELAAVLSSLIFESRRDPDQPPRIPRGRVEDVLREMHRLWGDLRALEARHRLDFLREPDAGFAWAAYRWANGEELDDILRGSTFSAGDFVRASKQLIDLAGQVSAASSDRALRRTAREVVDAVRRGVVAYTALD